MPAKKPSLSAALHEASGRKPAAAPATEPAAEPIETQEQNKTTQPGRRNTKAIGGHFDPAVSRQLKQLSLDEDKTVQTLLAEALNDLFVKYGRKPIA